MQARLALALFLSFLVLVLLRGRGGQPTAGPTPDGAPRSQEPAGLPPTTQPTPSEEAAAPPPPPIDEAEPWRETLSFGPYQATFDNRGAVLCELRLDGYYTEMFLDEEAKRDPTYWVPLCAEVDTGRELLASLMLSVEPSTQGWLAVDPSRVRWQARVERDGEERVRAVHFTLDGGRGVEFEKILRPAESGYDIEVEFLMRNHSAEELAGRQGSWRLTPAMGVPPAADDSFYIEPKACACWRKSKGEFGLERKRRNYEKRDSGAFPPSSDIVWGGVDNKYFVMALRPADPEASVALTGASWRTIWDAAWARSHPEDAEGKSYRHIATDLDLTTRLPEVGGEARYTFRLYAGPKQPPILLQHPDGEALARLVKADLGFFSGIAGILTSILGFFHGIIGNWGFSIILLTLFVRLALFPINRRSQTAMARHATKMKRVQPMLNAAKEKYAKDPRKLREEQARIMQEEGAFPPLGGCLPMFVQIPIFFGLFKALRTSFDLRQAPFIGWIHDLSEPDRFMHLGWHTPVIDMEYLNILPPVMVVLWIVQQRVMPKPTDEQAQRMQRMMMWMPVLFGFFLYNYAAGLSLYMITTSIFGILEQTVIKRIWPIDDSEKPRKKSGFMERLGELQKQAKTLEEMKRQAKAQRRQQHQRRKGKRG